MIYILEGPIGPTKEIIENLDKNNNYKILYKPTISNVSTIISFLEKNKRKNLIIINYFTMDFLLCKDVLIAKKEDLSKLENEIIKLNNYLESNENIKCLKYSCDVEDFVNERLDTINKIPIKENIDINLVKKELECFSREQYNDYDKWVFKLLSCFEKF